MAGRVRGDPGRCFELPVARAFFTEVANVFRFFAQQRRRAVLVDTIVAGIGDVVRYPGSDRHAVGFEHLRFARAFACSEFVVHQIQAQFFAIFHHIIFRFGDKHVAFAVDSDPLRRHRQRFMVIRFHAKFPLETTFFTVLVDRVVTGVGDEHIAFAVERDTARFFETPLSFFAKGLEEFAFGIELLDATVAGIGDELIPARVDGDALRFFQLPFF